MMLPHASNACDNRLVDPLRSAADGASRSWGRLGMDAMTSHDLD